MQIKFLGTGGAFDTDYLNSAALLDYNDKHFLIDCGFTVFPTLIKKSLINRVNYIILTHLHNDHCGSLANLLLYKSIVEKVKPPVILYPSESFRQEVYKFLKIQLKQPDKYAEFVPLEQFEGITAVDTFGQHSEGMQTYAYIFDNDIRYVYSGDLGKPEVLFEKLEKMPHKPTYVFHDITFNPENDGHTYYKKLLPYLNGLDMFGYHCDPTQNPSDNPIRLVFYEKDLMA
ncbi:MBL fold metallo-hydrolase [uncultured Pontibacter sp.]|uniref:MBL fold metallo-hydrolase n=1 Tax=uncultured Pontibacter sp. TaxID=453356 RepID=UPI0026214168|nr:MBL fold metallo-hydrolase [uncultured Pontibacter sp.]